MRRGTVPHTRGTVPHKPTALQPLHAPHIPAHWPGVSSPRALWSGTVQRSIGRAAPTRVGEEFEGGPSERHLQRRRAVVVAHQGIGQAATSTRQQTLSATALAAAHARSFSKTGPACVPGRLPCPVQAWPGAAVSGAHKLPWRAPAVTHPTSCSRPPLALNLQAPRGCTHCPHRCDKSSMGPEGGTPTLHSATRPG